MNTAAFWSIIDDARETGDRDTARHVARFQARIEQLSAAEIVAFQKHFDDCLQCAYSWSVWAAAEIIVGGCGDDSFYDFRGWLICQGRDIFEATLANPESLAGVVEPDNADTILDAFASVASDVWQKQTACDPKDFPSTGSNLGHDPLGEPWNPQDLPGLYPTLCRQFHYAVEQAKPDLELKKFESQRFEAVAGYPNPSQYPDRPEYKADEKFLIALMKKNGIKYNAQQPEMFSVRASQAEQARQLISAAIARQELTSVNIWPHVDINR